MQGPPLHTLLHLDFSQTCNQLSKLTSEVLDKYLSTEQLAHNALL